MFMLRVLELVFVLIASNLLIGIFTEFNPWAHLGVTLFFILAWGISLNAS